MDVCWNDKVLNQLTQIFLSMWESLTSTFMRWWSPFTFRIFVVRIETICILDSVHSSVCLILGFFAIFFKIPSMYLLKCLMSYIKKMWMNSVGKVTEGPCLTRILGLRKKPWEPGNENVDPLNSFTFHFVIGHQRLE